MDWIDEHAAALTAVFVGVIALSFLARFVYELVSRREDVAPPPSANMPSVWLEADGQRLFLRFENRCEGVIRDLRVTSVSGIEPTLEMTPGRGIPYLPPGAVMRRPVEFAGERVGLVTVSLAYQSGGQQLRESAEFDLAQFPAAEESGPAGDLHALRAEALHLRDMLTQTIDEINDGLIAGRQQEPAPHTNGYLNGNGVREDVLELSAPGHEGA